MNLLKRRICDVEKSASKKTINENLDGAWGGMNEQEKDKKSWRQINLKKEKTL